MIWKHGRDTRKYKKAGTRETTMTTDKRDKCIIEHLLEGIPIVISVR
jgi:hypothetical protein